MGVHRLQGKFTISHAAVGVCAIQLLKPMLSTPEIVVETLSPFGSPRNVAAYHSRAISPSPQMDRSCSVSQKRGLLTSCSSSDVDSSSGNHNNFSSPLQYADDTNPLMHQSTPSVPHGDEASMPEVAPSSLKPRAGVLTAPFGGSEREWKRNSLAGLSLISSTYQQLDGDDLKSAPQAHSEAVSRGIAHIATPTPADRMRIATVETERALPKGTVARRDKQEEKDMEKSPSFTAALGAMATLASTVGTSAEKDGGAAGEEYENLCADFSCGIALRCGMDSSDYSSNWIDHATACLALFVFGSLAALFYYIPSLHSTQLLGNPVWCWFWGLFLVCVVIYGGMRAQAVLESLVEHTLSTREVWLLYFASKAVVTSFGVLLSGTRSLACL